MHDNNGFCVEKFSLLLGDFSVIQIYSVPKFPLYYRSLYRVVCVAVLKHTIFRVTITNVNDAEYPFIIPTKARSVAMP